MNSKGEAIGEMGGILVVFVAIIVGLALLTASFGFIGTSTNSVILTNDSYTLASTANVSTEVTGMQEIIGTLYVINGTSGTAQGNGVPAAGINITVEECIGQDGLKAVCIKPTTAAFTSKLVNISGEFGPDGYIDSPGGRSIAGLVAIFAALAIAVTALVPTLRNGVLNLLSR